MFCFRPRNRLTFHNLEKLIMQLIDTLQTAANDVTASNDKVLASQAGLKAEIATLQAQLAALQGSSTLSPADAAQIQAIIDQLNAETAKNNAA